MDPAPPVAQVPPTCSTAKPNDVLSWVVPLFRTATALPELLRRIEETSARCRVEPEIILVDDACPDGSGARARDLALNSLATRVVQLPWNHGQDAALREGLRCCRGDWAILLDGDLQDPPEAAAQLLSARHGTDAVFASREGRYEGRIRLATSFLYRRCLERLGGFPRGACLFVLLGRPLIDEIAATHSARISLLAPLSRRGIVSTSVPVQRSVRPHGRSSYSSLARSRKAARALWQVLLVRHFGQRL